MTYHNTLLFGNELGWICEQLKQSASIQLVWRVASGIPQENGVCFCWQHKRFRINWYKGHWYVAIKHPFFWSAIREELVGFCRSMTAPTKN